MGNRKTLRHANPRYLRGFAPVIQRQDHAMHVRLLQFVQCQHTDGQFCLHA